MEVEMNIKDTVVKILGENGIEIDDEGVLLNLESLSFISTLVDIEQTFDIELPDEFLEIGKFDTVDDLVRGGSMCYHEKMSSCHR